MFKLFEKTIRHQPSPQRLIDFGANTRLFLSQFSWKQSDTPPITTSDVILKGKESYPDVFNHPDVNMTVLEHRDPAQSQEELKLLVKGFAKNGTQGVPARDLILHTLERLTLQVTAAVTPLFVKTPVNKKEYNEVIRRISEMVIEDNQNLMQQNLANARLAYAEFVRKAVREGSSAHVVQAFMSAEQTLTQRQQEGRIDLSPDARKDLSIDHVATTLLKDDLKTKLIPAVKEKIDEMVETRVYEALPLVGAEDAQTIYDLEEEKKNRLSILMAGGYGAGKSITAEAIAQALKSDLGLSIEDMARLSIDYSRWVYMNEPFMNHAKPEHYGTLTHEEAALTYYLSRSIVSRRAIDKKPVPHVFHEAGHIDSGWIRAALENEGNYLINISTRDVGNAVEGTIARGVDNKDRIPPSKLVLKSHKSVSEQFPKIIKDNGSTNMIISITNNEEEIQRKFNPETATSPQSSNNPAVVVNCRTNSLYIISLIEYIDFLAQKEINIEAKNKTELFPKGSTSIEKNIKRVLDPTHFGRTTINFVDPSIESASVNNLREHVVAEIKDGNLTIINPEVYAKMKSESPEHFTSIEEALHYEPDNTSGLAP